MTRADRSAAAAARRSTFELLCCSFWDIVGEHSWNIYLVNIHCFLTQECHHKKYMCRRAEPGRNRVNLKIVLFDCRKTDITQTVRQCSDLESINWLVINDGFHSLLWQSQISFEHQTNTKYHDQYRYYMDFKSSHCTVVTCVQLSSLSLSYWNLLKACKLISTEWCRQYLECGEKN